MSNGHVCCILGVCCPPDTDSQRQALKEEMAQELGGETSDYEQLVEWLTGTFDLVPKGVGKAIVEAYDPEFKKKYANRLTSE